MDVSPKVDSEILAHIRHQKIGQYVTYFNSNNKSRSHNISLAAKAIDNHVVFPNGTFSFNQVVGKRTKDKGYMSAPVIVRGELSKGVGGGVVRCHPSCLMLLIVPGYELISAIPTVGAYLMFHPDVMLP